MASNQNRWLGPLVVLIFALIIAIEPLYRKPLFDMTLEDVPRMQ